MLHIIVFGLEFLYLVCAAGLAVYSLHALWLVWQQARLTSPTKRPIEPVAWPAVTVQLPIFNERYVAERVIDACAQLDYPRHLLQLQVLDDSTDETIAIVDRCAARWREQGCNISVVRRSDRTGYKAGALAHALPQATGDFIAIFDADFRPEPDFLRRTIPYFFLEPEGGRIGFVQSRWGHLNREYSPLTQSQALALDGHFAVEQEGRQAANYFLGFNGSAGVWRRACIEDPQTGGWQEDTLCEDLDLSYRAQLAGWRPCYLNDVAAPAEIPPQLSAYKRQQFRWAKGSIQTLRKLGARVWRSERPLVVRLFALIHLGSYLVHPMLLLLLLSIPPLLLLKGELPSPMPLLGLTSLGPPLLYAIGQRRLYGSQWWRHWLYLPLLMLLGIGVCLNNSLAVWQGLRSRGGAFQRTPKFRVEHAQDRWRNSNYALPLDRVLLMEIGLMFYAMWATWLIVVSQGWFTAIFMLLYTASFAMMAGVSLWQNRPSKPRVQRRLQRLLRAFPVKKSPPPKKSARKSMKIFRSVAHGR
ncbi:glycosyltransferase [Caldilinea sp.]|uniref:glycosyltransferase n=1 Tax=Caldilinea sp. TaxID=2293560 RepID=UPI00262B8DDB|nr:glycosyltransferase [uncultured Caldilinea sp.]